MIEWVALIALVIMALVCAAVLFGAFVVVRTLAHALQEAHKKVMARDLTDLMNAEASSHYLSATPGGNNNIDWNAVRKSPEFQRMVNQTLNEYESRSSPFPYPGQEG